MARPLTVHYERHGNGTPALCFVHGFACALDDWRHQVAALRACHTVVACDLPGHGKSPGAPEACDIERFGDEVAQLLRETALADAILVGHSMGCRVVLQTCLAMPERVAGVVLIDGSFQGAAGAQAAEQAASAVAQRGYAAFARALFADMFLAPSDMSERINARAATLPEAIGARLFPAMARWDATHMRAALAAVRVPLLVIQSTYMNAERKRVSLQRGQSSPWLDMVRELAPHAGIEIVPGVGHFSMLEAPQEVNALLASFLARI